MRSSLLLAALCSSLALRAQITIGADDMPGAGDTLRFRTADGSAIPLAQMGEDQIWDFGFLTPQASVADTTVTVGSTPFLYQFYFNNPFLYPNYVADYAMKGTSIGFQQLSLSDLYDYYRVDADGFRNVGFGANVNGLPTSVRRQPVDVIHQFPMAYGNENTSFSAFEVTVPTLLYFGQDQQRTNTVDGWGTLYLPADTFEVLRVKSVLQRTDTIYIEQFGIGFRVPEPETVEYKWIAAGMGAPVLEVVTTGEVVISTRFFYEPEDITTALPVASHEPAFDLYPNPAQQEVYIGVPQGVAGTLKVLDAAGRVAHESFVSSGLLHRLDLNDLANGAYSVQLHHAGGVSARKLIVQR